MANNIPITAGSGSASVATETVGGVSYQQVQIWGPGGASVLSVNADGTLNARISGSVAAVSSPGSVSGTVGASIVGQLPGGTAVIGSVAALQGTNPWVIVGSVYGTGSVVAFQGGPQTTSIVGGASVFQTGTWSVSVAGVANIAGSVAAWLQSSNASVITVGTAAPNQSVSGTVQVDVRGSVAVAIISGSIAATFTPPANQSVSGTIQADIRGSVAAFIIGGSVATATTNSSVMLLNGANTIGSVTALQGTNPWIVTSSVAGGLFPISGSVAATITNANVNVSGSVAAFIVGSSSVITLNQGSSILAVPVGSVITVLQAASIVGTYAEDAASATGDKGFLVMGARNDTLSSVTSADGDYSSHVVGPSGELIAANAPFTKWISGTTSIMYGASVAVIAAQGTSIFSYITGVQIANMSANQALITFQGASSSTLGFTIAPANGGSNIVFANALKTNANGAFTASINGVSSIYVSAQGFIAKI